MRALVIDDSKTTRMILGSILRPLGFEVLEASNGQEGLASLTSGVSPDIILVDWNMPEMNGVEFVAKMRTYPEYASLPVMMVTTESSTDCLRQALGAGVSEFVMKPFTRDVIREKLQLLGIQ